MEYPDSFKLIDCQLDLMSCSMFYKLLNHAKVFDLLLDPQERVDLKFVSLNTSKIVFIFESFFAAHARSIVIFKGATVSIHPASAPAFILNRGSSTSLLELSYKLAYYWQH